MHEATLEMRRAVARREGVERRAVHIVALLFFGAGVLFAIVGWLNGDSFFLRLATEALIYAGLALSVDILLGYTGLLSLGQALYFGLGAYVSALALKEIAPSFWLAIGLASVAGTIFGLIGGIIANRVRGVYFALITFGMAQVVSKIVYNTRELGASDGIIGIPQIEINLWAFTVDTANPAAFFLFLLAFTGALYALLAYLMDTPFGRTLLAIRANEGRVPFLGFNPRLYKIAAFVLAANVAAIAGAFYPMLRGFVSPELMFFMTSGDAVIMTILGGVGTLIGPILGSVLLVFLRSMIGTLTEHHLIVIGILFALAVIFLPKGITGFLKSRLQRYLSAREKTP